MIFDTIVRKSPPGTSIPKPKTNNPHYVKGIGRRRGEEALVYYIPNHSNPDKPHQKGITRSEFQKAFDELVRSGAFTKSWFNRHLQECSYEGSCNFTTIGGLFQLIGIAKYSSPGVYKRR